MSDYGEIRTLITRLAWMLDHEEYDGFMDNWVEGGKLEFTFADGMVMHRQGQEIVEGLKGAYPTLASKCLHIPTTPVVDFAGDEARVRYYILLTHWGPQARNVGAAECDIQVRKGADGRWRVALLKEKQLLVFDRVAA